MRYWGTMLAVNELPFGPVGFDSLTVDQFAISDMC